MTWTSEKPTVAGWYWMRAPKCGWRDCVVWVDQDDDGLYIDVGDCDSEYVMDIEAEWLGPITPDSYQQGRVAGLREAHVFAMEAGAFYTAHRIGALIDKAQQAQDEKGVGDVHG